MKKRKRAWRFWIGFVDGRPHIEGVIDDHCPAESDGVQTAAMFVHRGDARIRYRDVRRVRLVEVVPSKAKKRRGAK